MSRRVPSASSASLIVLGITTTIMSLRREKQEEIEKGREK